MPNSSSNPSSAPNPDDPRYTRKRIGKNFARVVNRLLVQTAIRDGEHYDVIPEQQVKYELKLFDLLPKLLHVIPKARPTPDEADPELDPRFDHVHIPGPSIPICPCCLQGPGTHWVEDCPDLKTHHKLQTFKELQNAGRVR